MGELRDSRALEPLIKVFENNEFRTKHDRPVIIALGDIGGARAVEFLIKLIDEGMYGLLNEIISALRKLSDSRAIEPLIKHLLFNDYCRYGDNIVLALSELGEPQWGDLVKGNSDDFLRLAEAQDPRATMPLITALFKYNDSKVINAAEALGLRGDIHDKKSQEKNGDFPRPARMPPVVNLNSSFPVQSFSFFPVGQPDDQATRHPFTVFGQKHSWEFELIRQIWFS